MGIALCFIPLIIGILIFALAFKMKLTHLLIAALLGLVAVLPISLIQYFIPDLSVLFSSPILFSLVQSLVIYGFIEEAIKTLALLLLPHKLYDNNSTVGGALDGAGSSASGGALSDRLGFLLLVFTAGLSLGCFESVVYYFDHLQIANSRGATLLYGQIAVRIFTSDVIHWSCTGLCGLFIYSYRNKPGRVSCLVAAVLLHGIYDFFAGFSGGLRWFSVAVVLMSIAECRIKYKSLQTDENSAN